MSNPQPPRDVGHDTDHVKSANPRVLPTRVARNGTVFTYQGAFVLKGGQYKADFRPIEEDCDCFACQRMGQDDGRCAGALRGFGDRLGAINAGIEKDGAFYLFTLRLVPLFPFFVINLVMGLTPIRTWVFYLVSQIGMLAGTVVYVNAGTQLGQIKSTADILSPGLIGSFVLLGLFPLIAKKFVELSRRARTS